jgi:pseudaminic acid biosynthesis-associated methylase
MNEQQNFWKNSYATDYINKNSDFDIPTGIDAWNNMLSKVDKNKLNNGLLECGCNIGKNLDFLTHIIPEVPKSIIEISEPAYNYVVEKFNLESHFNGAIEDSKFESNKFDLVFSMGVLIHINPDNLKDVMQKMYDYSKSYILIGEYFNRTPVMINYNGEDNKLFKRDFGKLFIESFNVDLVDYGFLWGHLYDKSGFDDITWWLFKKK